MTPTLHPMLNIAVRAARAAGAIINHSALDLELLHVARKGPNDFVSEVDRAAEQAIIDILLDAYPGHGILAEETGRERGAKDSEYLWIIDPLDGTTNFLHGFPVYAVSIALAHRGIVQQAVVYDPTRNDLFIASRGRGAYVNDRRLRVSKRTRLADSLIGTGFPFRKGDNFARYVKMFEQVMQSCAGLRRPGAAALDLCYVAAGWYDGFFEMGLSPWDAAAGSLMITEAGGLVGNFSGEADFLYQRELVAGTPKVYGQLVQILQPYTRVIAPAAASRPASRPASPPASPPVSSPLSSPLSPPAPADATQAFVDAAADDAPAPDAGSAPMRAIVRVKKVERVEGVEKIDRATKPPRAGPGRPSGPSGPGRSGGPGGSGRPAGPGRSTATRGAGSRRDAPPPPRKPRTP